MQRRASRAAGFAYPAYAQLKLSVIVDGLSELLAALGGDPSAAQRQALRRTLHDALTQAGIDRCGHGTRDGASPELISFLRSHDVDFRIRRLRFLTRQLAPAEESNTARRTASWRAKHCVICSTRPLPAIPRSRRPPFTTPPAAPPPGRH